MAEWVCSFAHFQQIGIELPRLPIVVHQLQLGHVHRIVGGLQNVLEHGPEVGMGQNMSIVGHNERIPIDTDLRGREISKINFN